MVGRMVNADYRAHVNFLSLLDYRAYRANYSQIRIQPIVCSMTGQYHATVTSHNKSC